MKTLFFVSSQSAREAAERKLSFVEECVRRDVLGSLSYLVVAERSYDRSRDVELARRIAEAIGEAGLLEEIANATTTYTWNGAYIKNRRTIIIWFVDKGHPDILKNTPWIAHPYYKMDALVHEIAHHYIMNTRTGTKPTLLILEELLLLDTDLAPLLDKISNLLHEAGERAMRAKDEEMLEKVNKVYNALTRFTFDLIDFVNELTAEYIATNYFVLLNTKAHQSPIWLGDRAVSSVKTRSRAHEPLWGLYRTLKIFQELLFTLSVRIIEIKMKDVLTKLSESNIITPHEANTLSWQVDDIEFKALATEVLPRYQHEVERIASEMLEKMPLDVYRRNPEKYGKLFKDIDWSSLEGWSIIYMT
jgi:hypothetical protein